MNGWVGAGPCGISRNKSPQSAGPGPGVNGWAGAGVNGTCRGRGCKGSAVVLVELAGPVGGLADAVVGRGERERGGGRRHPGGSAGTMVSAVCKAASCKDIWRKPLAFEPNIYIYAFIHIYIYTYMCIFIYMHIYTYT